MKTYYRRRSISITTSNSIISTQISSVLPNAAVSNVSRLSQQLLYNELPEIVFSGNQITHHLV
ncbi:hypothetical protein PGB90_006903 [Kerria lacca]